MTAAFRLRVLPRVLPIDGREVGFQNDGTYIQWRYEATDTQAASDWTNLVALADITGPEGPNVELRNNGTSLQWRVEGDVSWIDLISIADMTAGATAEAEGYAADAAASAAAALAAVPNAFPATRTILKGYDTATITAAYLREAGREGQFLWNSADLSGIILGSAIASSAVNSTTDTITSVGHGLYSGMAAIATTAVNGLATNTIYYVIRVDADNFRIASSFANALAGTAFNLTGIAAVTVRQHFDPQEGIFVCPASDITGASGAWRRAYQGGIDARWFDVVADYDDATSTGTDNTEAMAAAVNIVTGDPTNNAIHNDPIGGGLILPPGNILVEQVTCYRPGLRMHGAGKFETVIVGSDATNDVILLGDGVVNMVGLDLQGFTIDASVTKTAGWGLRIRKCVRSTIRELMLTGQDRAEQIGKRLYHGAWFDECDFIPLDVFQSWVQQTGLRVNGSSTYFAGPQSDLFISNTKIADCAIGVEVAGGIGGLVFGNGVSVIQNGYGMLVNKTQVDTANPNREIFIGSGAFFDGSTNENIVIQDDSLQKFSMVGGWACSSGAAEGIRVESMAGQFIVVGSIIKGNATDGIDIQDPDTECIIVGNDISSNGGYGVRWTTAPTSRDAQTVEANLLSNNTSGETLNLSFVRMTGDGNGGKMEVRGITNGDLELTPTGTGLIDVGGAATSGSAGAGGGGSLPATIGGYLKLKIGGTEVRVPYYPTS